MTQRIGATSSPRLVAMAPALAAFAELRRKGIFDKTLPKDINGVTWLAASPAILNGVGPATAQLLAAKGIKTVGDVAQSRAMWPREFPQAGKALAAAHAALQAAMAKYNLGGSLVDSPYSKPVNMPTVQVQQGNGQRPTTLTIGYMTNDSAHQLVYAIAANPSKITVRIADYRDPNLFGAQVISRKTATIDLGVLTTGASIEVVNKDGRVLFTGATPATSIPGFGRPPAVR